MASEAVKTVAQALENEGVPPIGVQGVPTLKHTLDLATHVEKRVDCLD